VSSAARATRIGGRVVAPVTAAIPDGVRELARDDRVWVGAREAMPSVPITLHVRRGGDGQVVPPQPRTSLD